MTLERKPPRSSDGSLRGFSFTQLVVICIVSAKNLDFKTHKYCNQIITKPLLTVAAMILDISGHPQFGDIRTVSL